MLSFSSSFYFVDFSMPVIAYLAEFTEIRQNLNKTHSHEQYACFVVFFVISVWPIHKEIGGKKTTKICRDCAHLSQHTYNQFKWHLIKSILALYFVLLFSSLSLSLSAFSSRLRFPQLHWAQYLLLFVVFAIIAYFVSAIA